jgi:hypothetical protein
MMGCVFCISAKFFWELGGYDPGKILINENQEVLLIFIISFQNWRFGGELDQKL